MHQINYAQWEIDQAAANSAEAARIARDGSVPPGEPQRTIPEHECDDGHHNEAGGYCCPHVGNTCGGPHYWD